MQGKIVRGIAGFYYVHVPELGILECKAKGAFRNRKEKPLVGDNVEVELLDPDRQTGNVECILPRRNELIRPAVANVDQAIVIFAVSYPRPNLNLLDRFLLMMKTQGIPAGICFNKMDMVQEEEVQEMILQYRHSGVRVYQTSARRKEGLDILQESLSGKTTVLAGPSGTGKSSVINAIFPDAQMETGQISEKIKRGRHTTRHSELFSLGGNTYLMDTPGFTSLGLPDLEKEELRNYYEEFLPYQDACRFLGCVHVNEPDCAVKAALDQGKIARKRYENYKQFFEELSQKRRY